MKKDFLEYGPIYYWLCLSDRPMDTLMHGDSWKDERIVGGRGKRSEEPNGDMFVGPAKLADRGVRKWCLLEVRQEHFPLLVASISGVQLHTHTHIHTHMFYALMWSSGTRRLRLNYWLHWNRSRRTAEVSLLKVLSDDSHS